MNIVILCGPSGVGKTSLLTSLKGYVIPIGYTTRPLRNGEDTIFYVDPLPNIWYAERISYDGYEYALPASAFVEGVNYAVVAGLDGIRQLRRFCNNITVVYINDQLLENRRPIDPSYEQQLIEESDFVLTRKEAYEFLCL